jgi:hypothetical protein
MMEREAKLDEASKEERRGEGQVSGIPYIVLFFVEILANILEDRFVQKKLNPLS